MQSKGQTLVTPGGRTWADNALVELSNICDTGLQEMLGGGSQRAYP